LYCIVLHRSRCVSLFCAYLPGIANEGANAMNAIGRNLFRAAAAIGVALLLSGCVIYPAGGGYHPHYWGWYR
jgi:hypothetical protein